MAGPIARLRDSLALAWKSATIGARAGWGGQGINWTRNGGIPTSWAWNYWQQGLRPLQGGESATVNACVNAYAMTIGQLPGQHMRTLPGGGAEPVTTSALSRILRQPNPYQTRSDFMLNLVSQMLFHGSAYAWAERNGKQEAQALHLMPGRGCEPYLDPESRSIFYALGENPLAGEFDYLVPARDVLHLRARCHPLRPLHGISPITWAAMARDANLAISATQAAFFANASQPSGFLSSKENLTREQWESAKANWKDRTAGISAGEVPIVMGGFEFQQMGISSQDSQLVEAFGMTVADIARAFAVPLPVIGDLAAATFNNVENLIGLWLSQGLGFYVEHLETALDRFFGLPPGEYVELDTDVLMRTAFRDRIEGLTRAISGGLYAPDEARAREGLPPAPDGFGEEPRLQAQVVPLSQVGQTPAAPSAPAAPGSPGPPVAPAELAGDNPATANDNAATKALIEAIDRLEDRAETREAEAIARHDALAARLEPPAIDTSQALAMIRASMAARRERAER